MRSAVGGVVWLPRGTFHSVYDSQAAETVPDFPGLTLLQGAFAFQAGFSECLA